MSERTEQLHTATSRGAASHYGAFFYIPDNLKQFVRSMAVQHLPVEQIHATLCQRAHFLDTPVTWDVPFLNTFVQHVQATSDSGYSVPLTNVFQHPSGTLPSVAYDNGGADSRFPSLVPVVPHGSTHLQAPLAQMQIAMHRLVVW